MGDAKGRESTLELGTGIAAIAGGLMAEEGQAISIEGQRQAVSAKGAAKVLEMVPSGIGRDEDSPHKLAGMIVDRQEESLLVRGGPPLVDRRIVLPEFAHPCAFPSPSRLGCWGGCVDQEWEVTTGIGSDGFAVALKGKAGSQFIGDKLVIGRSLQRQEIFQELPHIVRPSGTMVAPGEVESKGGRVSKPSGAQAKEMGAADIQKLGGAVGIELALVEGVQGLLQERQGDALKQLAFCIARLDAGGARSARLFVGLRYAPASSKPGTAGESILHRWASDRSVSFCSPSSLILFPPRQPIPSDRQNQGSE
jgi:hypothetical protein